ncbi:MAG: translation initiation factor IF-2, partial [Desulfobacteraceae bacterium]
MTNKALLTKLKAMNIEVKSHMSSLENGTVKTVKDTLFGNRDKGDETRVKTSVIRRRKAREPEKKQNVSGGDESGSEEETPRREEEQPAAPAAADAGEKAAAKKRSFPAKEKPGAKTSDGQDESAVGQPLSEQNSAREVTAGEAPDEPVRDMDGKEETGDVETTEPGHGKQSIGGEVETAEYPAETAEKPAAQGAGPEKLKETADGEKMSSEARASGDAVQETVSSEAGYMEKEKVETIPSESGETEKEAEEEAEKEVEQETEQETEEESPSENGSVSPADAGEAPPSETHVAGDKEESDDRKKKKKKSKKSAEPAKIIKMAVPPSIAQPKKKAKPEKKKEGVKSRKNFANKDAAPARPQKKAPAAPAPGEGPVVQDPDQTKDTGRAKKKDWKKKSGKQDAPAFEEKKGGARKKKSVVEGKDLYEKKGFGNKKRQKKDFKSKKKPSTQKTQITTPKAIKRRIKIDETIELAELAKRMGIKANQMIQKLMGLGVMVTVNQTIDFDTASLVAAEFDYEVEKASFEEDLLIHAKQDDIDDSEKKVLRSPVVTIMGHVDHGKTSLLDVIRTSKITTGEAGGITQHIGAYSVETTSGVITFLDTPGHAAFTSMRSRGAQVTDIVVLVVAADDGVMPQTIEAINHSKAAGVPVVVAVNKMDKPDADPDKVIRQLSEHGLVAEEWGGDVIFARVSAKAKQGINELLEMILLQAEVLELKANPDKLASGHVVESRLDAGRGPVATILVEQGTLKAGQPVVCGLHSGKIRVMIGDTGSDVETAGPSTPVEIVGLGGVPEAGDEFVALDSEKDAKQISENRMQKDRAKDLAKKSRANLEKLFANMGADEVKELKLIVKADVHGSIEALSDSLMKLAQEEVSIKIVHSGTGAINESDVSLATVSDAIIIGFNVRPTPNVRHMAKEENVDIRFYDIIYNVINDIKAAITGLMPSTFHENILGRAQVRDTFVIPGKGTIAGSFILEGKITRGGKVRLIRDGVVKCDSTVGSLKRFKDDAKEVVQGYECGIGIEKFNDVKVDDIIECYEIQEKRPEMESIKS